MREVVPKTRAYFDGSDEAWQEAMERIVAASTEPNARRRRRERADGSVIDWAQVPLPDGQPLSGIAGTARGAGDFDQSHSRVDEPIDVDCRTQLIDKLLIHCHGRTW